MISNPMKVHLVIWMEALKTQSSQHRLLSDTENVKWQSQHLESDLNFDFIFRLFLLLGSHFEQEERVGGNDVSTAWKTKLTHIVLVLLQHPVAFIVSAVFFCLRKYDVRNNKKEITTQSNWSEYSCISLFTLVCCSGHMMVFQAPPPLYHVGFDPKKSECNKKSAI